MTRLVYSLFAALTLSMSSALADEHPVVVELYTSQGCSSCPPADAYLHKLAARDDVIALALHVDYWDYIGWKDSFGQSAWSDRQRSYAKTSGRTMVYTPQMIINGVDHVVGNRPKDVENLIERHTDGPAALSVSAVRASDTVTISASMQGDSTGPMIVQLVRYMPKQSVKITRGENAGRTLSYANIVTEIEIVDTWNGRAPLSLRASMVGDQPAVVLIQKKGHGEVIAATKVK